MTFKQKKEMKQIDLLKWKRIDKLADKVILIVGIITVGAIIIVMVWR